VRFSAGGQERATVRSRAMAGRGSSSDGPQSGDNDVDLGIPDARPWLDPVRSRLASMRSLRVPEVLWLLAFPVAHYVAFGVVMGLHPAGFDDCEATASSQAERWMVIVAAMAVLGPGALATWRFRGLFRFVTLVIVAIAGVCWSGFLLLVLGDQQRCAG
jgi:hypothetical protein